MNRSGVSLTELVIAIGVTGIVMLALSSVMVNNQKLAGSVEQFTGTSILKAQMALFLNQKRNCEQNFAGGTFDPNINQPLTQLSGRTSTGSVYVKYGITAPQNEIGSGLRITSLRYVAPTSAMNVEESATAEIEVVVERVRQTAGLGTPSTSFRFPVLLTTGRTLPVRVQSCSAVSAEDIGCVVQTQSTGGRSTPVFCPMDYRVVGGGLRDGNISKGDHSNRPIAPSAGNPWGGWYCDTDDPGGTLECSVICCR